MPISERMRLRAIAAIALAGAMALSPTIEAQEASFPNFSTYDMFPPESPAPDPVVVRQLAEQMRAARALDGCSLGRLKLRTPTGDTLFQQALAAARQAAVLAALDRLGVPVAGRLFVESTVFGDESGHDAIYESPRDAQPPRLHTTSVPAEGTRVEAGDEITVTMVARDDAAPRDWQTGIKTMQLVADSEAGAFVASENYEACADVAERRVVATYIVPQDPPPVVRLSALAEDHAGLADTDAAEFPTEGDWYGRLVWSLHSKEDTSRRPNENRAETQFDGQADIIVTYDGPGNLSGTLVGTQKVATLWWGYPHGSGETCKGSAPPTPVRARIVGSYTPGRDALSLQLIDVEAQIVVPWTWTGGGSYLDCPPFPIDNGPSLSGLARSLQPVGDGTYRAGWDASGGLTEHRWSMTLRRTAE
jgi:hypothetical protein